MAARQESCCFSGHRPDKLPWGDCEDDPRCRSLRRRVTEAALTAYDEGFRHFLCGMAQGCDLIFGEQILKLREVCGGVTLEAAVPFPEQADDWPPSQRERYRRLLDACDHRMVLSPHYTPCCPLRRNRYMVDHASLLIAVYDGSSGGTRYTVEYALRRGIEVRRVPVLDGDGWPP